MYPYIVADIGGTNARFALVTGKHQQVYQIEQIQVLSADEHATFADGLQAYLDIVGNVRPQAACVAVAGPVTGDQVRMTNRNWTFSCRAMEETFGLQRFVAMNDFAAVAAACAQLTDKHLLNIKKGQMEENATKAVFGPGTGLGVAGLVNYLGQWVPVPCEGGHVNLAPATPLEAEVIKAAMQQHGHVSAEFFISGPGLVNLYRMLGVVRDEKIDDVQPADITLGAINGSNELFRETLLTFCSFAGAFAGNLALTYGAKGGIYIAGGILPRVSDFLSASPFQERFANKGVMSHYLESIPANLIIHPETAFVGAAAWLEQRLARG